MILIAIAILGCMILVATIVIGLIKRANRRMDEQNKEMKTYLRQYGDTKKITGRGGKSAG